MGKRALRPGELVTVNQVVDRHGITMFAAPNAKLFNGVAMGHFTFGIYIASARGPALMHRDTTTYLYLLDSATSRAGWCLAKYVRRPNAPEDG